MDLTYAAVLTGQYEAVRSAMDRIIAAELAAVVPALRWVLAAHFSIQFVLFGLGRTAGIPVILTFVRSVIIIFVLTGAGVWTGYVRDYAFEKVPNALAAAATGNTTRLTAPQQFDTVSMAIDNLAAEVRRQNTSWSVTAFGNAIATWLVWGGLQFMLAIQAYVWLASIRIMAIALCVGVWLTLFELFDRTRGYFQHWIGLIVGLWTFQLAAAVFLQISMQSEMELLRSVERQSRASNSVDIMIANLGHVSTTLFGDALTMLVLPAVFGGVAGAGSQIGVARAVHAMPGIAGRAMSRMHSLKQRVHG